VSSDGPNNLLTAVHAGKAFADRGAGGMFVAFNETVHSARTVTKAHTSALEAFRSRNAGPVATVDRNGVAIHRPPRSETRPIETTSLAATVFTIKSGSAVTGDLLEAALERDADGIVIEGTGLGNATAGVADAIRDAIDADIPVVVTSRCLEGRVTPIYGGNGVGIDSASTARSSLAISPHTRPEFGLRWRSRRSTTRKAIRASFASADRSWSPSDQT